MNSGGERKSIPKRFVMMDEMHHWKIGLVRDEQGLFHRFVEVGDVRRMILYLDKYKRRLRAVARSKSDPWVRNFRGRRILSKEARELWYSIRDVDEYAQDSLVEGRRLDPWLALGLRLARKWRLRLIHAIDKNGLLLGSDEIACSGMVEIFKSIRKECRAKDFLREVNNLARGARDSYQSCVRYMLSVLAEHARPLILRVDLYFEGDGKVASDSDAARKAFDKFIRALREDRIVPDVLRYITKREDGLERRIHYHVLLALNGDKHRRAYELSEQVGKFWVDECVGSPLLSSYFNVWLRRHEFEYSCLGHLHYLDERMLEGLRRCIWYLCEDGAHVLVRNGRNLRKGQMPSGGRGRARGRPRADGTSLAVAERILLKPPPAEKERLVLPERGSAGELHGCSDVPLLFRSTRLGTHESKQAPPA